MVKCGCGFAVATRTSWTHDNPGRKFRACKFYNHETGQRRCKTFEWVDEGQTDWQREVMYVLVAEKHRLATDNIIIKARLVCVEHEKNRLNHDLEKLRKKPLMRKKESFARNETVGCKMVSICVLLYVIVSFMFVKVFVWLCYVILTKCHGPSMERKDCVFFP
ncbi:uncharacterized protein At4g04775-like [Beta vulgaris subsp. vulgaris]|uniref:uncharacterized protein At4g04775-like n=1 Tax=Beta vulgaris subsp. vulgaris TaxID=3555 RepID=UPI002036A5CE|nr:uncharacterized protein At4g04775-like [Beta vulgaris subsp. vulgaris]